MSELHTAGHASAAGKPLAIRILDAHFERTWAAREEYAARLAERDDLTRDDIFMDTLRRATDGVEPTWLRRAKQLHDEIGKCIYVVSQAPSPHLSTDVVMEAESRVRAFVDAMPGQVSQDRIDAMAFLAVIQAGSTRDPSLTEPLDAGQPPEEVVCFALSFHDVLLAIRVAMFVDDVAKVLARWRDDSPRRPTKWTLIATLWSNVTGRKWSAETLRRYDPRKKQVAPGRVANRIRRPKRLG